MKNLKHNELTFQLMVEASPNALILVNQQGKIAYLNKYAEELFYYNKQELIGQKLTILIPKRFKEKHPDLLQSFFINPVNRQMGINRELFALKKDNTEFPVEIGLNPIVTVDGVFVLAAIIDITERKRAEEQFQLVVESAANSIILVNETGEIVLVNKRTEELFGYARAELIGKKMELLLPERFKNKHSKLQKQFVENPQTRLMGVGRDLFARRKDGSEVPIEIGLNPIKGTLILASIIDITDRRKRELELELYRQKLEETNKSLNMFASIAAHDLKSPLNSIIGLVQLIEMEMVDNKNENITRYIQLLKQINFQSKDLIHGILEYSKNSFSAKKLEKIDLKILIKTIVNKYKLNSKISIVIGKSLPVVQYYKTALTQVINNLLDNAIKYNDKNICEINIDCVDLGSYFEFSISDNGPGIVKSDREKIFNLFENLRNKKEDSTGIGLATVKKIIIEANGRIWVESSVLKGAKFIFTIKK